jgi:hypothetical protein
MIWTTWRQFRTQTWVAIIALAAAAVALGATGIRLAALWNDSGAATCTRTCDATVESFIEQALVGPTNVIYGLSMFAMYLLPPVLGAFWGAPLVARELESGTHRLAWNQSVTRRRWLATKLALVGGATMAVVGLISLGVTLWSARLDQDGRIAPTLFGTRGIVPVAYAAFAFALGVAAGMLFRRTVPAMATTLFGYGAAVLTMALWGRARLLPAKHELVPLNLDNLHGFSMGGGGQMQITADAPSGAGWVISNLTVRPDGTEFTGPADPAFCGRDLSPRSCIQWAGTLNLRQSLTYHPVSHFWALQWIESGVFLAVAALLIVWCFRRVNRLA